MCFYSITLAAVWRTVGKWGKNRDLETSEEAVDNFLAEMRAI